MKKFRHVMIAVLMIAMVLTMALPVYASEEESDILIAPASSELTAAQVKAITPTVSATSYSYSKIKVTWEKIDGLDGYIVYRAASKNGTYYKAFTTTKSSYINTGRTTGKYYFYKVRGYKKMNGKTVYTKYSPVTATYARPNKVKINEAYGRSSGVGGITLDWQPVSGASRYEVQANWKKDGKWSGWKTYTPNFWGEKEEIQTYYSLLASEKKNNPNTSEVTILVDGKITTMSIEEACELSIGKTQARADVLEDDRTYKFRVRAYRTVNGKKIYGAWSDEYTLKETLNKDEILAALRQYTIDYAKKNNPKFQYLDDRESSTPEDSAYYVQGAFAGFSMYARQEDVIEAYKETIARYVDSVGRSGENCGFLFIRKSYPGDAEGISENVTDETYYAMWMLY